MHKREGHCVDIEEVEEEEVTLEIGRCVEKLSEIMVRQGGKKNCERHELAFLEPYIQE